MSTTSSPSAQPLPPDENGSEQKSTVKFTKVDSGEHAARDHIFELMGDEKLTLDVGTKNRGAEFIDGSPRQAVFAQLYNPTEEASPETEELPVENNNQADPKSTNAPIKDQNPLGYGFERLERRDM